MKQTHKIQKQSLLLNFTNEAEATSWNRSASEFNQKNIVPVLDKLFDRYAGKNEYFEIEKLEVNIGLVSEENFLLALENELKKELDSIFPGRLITEHDPAHAELQSGKDVKNPSNDESEKHANRLESIHWIDTFSYFLDYGTLPWNSRTQTIKTLQKEVTRIISQNGLEKPNGLRQQLLNSTSRKRLYYQFSTDFNFQVLSKLFVSEYQVLMKMHNGLTEIFKSAAQNNVPESEIQITGSKPELIRWIGLEASSEPDLWPLEYIEFLVKTVFRKDQRHANELLKKAAQLSVQRRDVVFFWIRKYLKDKEFSGNYAFTLKGKKRLTGKSRTAGTDLKSSAENELTSENREGLKTKSAQQTEEESKAEIPDKYAEEFKQNAGYTQKGKGDSDENKIRVPDENDRNIKPERDKALIRKKENVENDSVTSHETKQTPESVKLEKEDLKKSLTGIKAKSKSRRQRQDEELLKSRKKRSRLDLKGTAIMSFRPNPISII